MQLLFLVLLGPLSHFGTLENRVPLKPVLCVCVWGGGEGGVVCSSANHIAVQRRVSNKTETTTIVLLSILCFQMELYKFQLHCFFYHFSWLAHSEGQSEINLTDYNLSTTIRDMGRYARYDARCRARHASSDGEEEEPCDRKSRKRKNCDSNGPRMSKSENDIDCKRKRFQWKMRFDVR